MSNFQFYKNTWLTINIISVFEYTITLFINIVY